LAVSAYLVSHFYDKGMETGFKKGRIAGWNTGYREGQESMMEVIKEVQTKNRFSSFDHDDVDRKLRDIEMKLDDAEWQRKFGK
jgi:flagellar biosynthesis/type III secretory pathway protein FliH